MKTIKKKNIYIYIYKIKNKKFNKMKNGKMNQKTPFLSKKGREPLTPIRICGGYSIVPVRAECGLLLRVLRFRCFTKTNFLHAIHIERCVTLRGLVPFLLDFFLSPSFDRLEKTILTGIASAFQVLLIGIGDTSQTARMGPTSRLWEGCRITGIGCVSIPCTK